MPRTKKIAVPAVIQMNLQTSIVQFLADKKVVTLDDLLGYQGIDPDDAEHPEHNRALAAAARKIVEKLGWRPGQVGYPREPGFVR